MTADMSACYNKDTDRILISFCNGDFADIFQIC
jgi:hypothetical protein